MASRGAAKKQRTIWDVAKIEQLQNGAVRALYVGDKEKTPEKACT